jgi:hypothetical protein
MSLPVIEKSKEYPSQNYNHFFLAFRLRSPQNNTVKMPPFTYRSTLKNAQEFLKNVHPNGVFYKI